MRWLVENGFMSRENFSETVLFILRRAQKAGELTTPPAWFIAANKQKK